MSEYLSALQAAAAAADIPAPPGALAKLAVYFELMRAHNRHVNLTAVIEPAEVAVRHFADSLAPPALARLPRGAQIIDVGTGAGLPGVVLCAMRPDLHAVLLDGTRKRIDFITDALREAGIPNAQPVWARAEDFGRGAGRARFDCAVSRAVAALPTLLELCIPLIKPGGSALCWKGPAAPAECLAAQRAARLLGAAPPVAHPYHLAGRDEYFIVEALKKLPTPARYPRRAGIPGKEPL